MTSIENRGASAGAARPVAFLLRDALGLLVLFEDDAAAIGERGGEITFNATRANGFIVLKNAITPAVPLLLDAFSEPAIRGAARLAACVAGKDGFRIFPRRISIRWET